MLLQLCHQLGAVPTELGVIGDMLMLTGNQLQFELLFRAFAVAVRRFPQVFIVIDAVDECSDIRRLIATLQSMIDWELDGLHLFLSTRHQLQPISERLTSRHHLHYVRMTDGNRQDTLTLIKGWVSKQQGLPNTAKEEVIRMLAARADGS